MQGHKTRLAYEDPQSRQLINPCPGVCVDGQGGARSIASNSTVEFYLNSHAAIQGTAKCTKYTLIHDEVTAIAYPSRVQRCLTPAPHPLTRPPTFLASLLQIGFTLSEIEMLTYWTTYLYTRCNRSVSIATPAYYADLAAERARTLVKASVDASDMEDVNTEFSKPGRPSMYFI